MGRRRNGGRPRSYPCPDPPCIHVVIDDRRRIFRVFIEESDGSVVSVPLEKLENACRELSWARQQGYREADPDETDFLARRYLEARPEEEEW